jgi:hypothetical protein
LYYPFWISSSVLTLACETFVIITEEDFYVMFIGSPYSGLPRIAWGLIWSYLLMNRGAKKAPGGLTLLNSSFKPISSPKELPGIVVLDFYLKESGRWLLFTVSSDNNNPVSKLTCYDLKTEETTSISLNGPPVAYRFNEDRTELAVGTLGNAKNKAPAELALIDLAQKQIKRFPVSANPGAIYQTASGKIVVACGGFRNNQKYPSKISLEKTDSAELAKLH